MKSWHHAPWIVLTLSVLAISIFSLPGLNAALEYDRQAIAGGQLWRLLTGHFTHWSFDHLIYDVLGFLVLGAICELRDRQRLLRALGLATVALAAALWLNPVSYDYYRGLSGLDSALFALAACSVGRQAWASGNRRLLIVTVVFGGLFCAKVGFELISGNTVFVDGAAGVQAVPSAHVIGAMAGALVAFFDLAPPSRPARALDSPYRLFTQHS